MITILLVAAFILVVAALIGHTAFNRYLSENQDNDADLPDVLESGQYSIEPFRDLRRGEMNRVTCILCGEWLADADEDHLPRFLNMLLTHPHECGTEG